MEWQPVLDGELADRARIAIREVADVLATTDMAPVDRAVFWAYVAPELGEVGLLEQPPSTG